MPNEDMKVIAVMSRKGGAGKTTLIRALASAAMREGKWKLVTKTLSNKFFDTLTWDLYDLSVDMTETQNVANQHPELVDRLDGLWRKWQAEVYD